jgi:hypothetical protein
LRKSLPILISSRKFPVPSCSNFKVSGLIFRSLIHFELIVVQGDRHGLSRSYETSSSMNNSKTLMRSRWWLSQSFLQ